ncbi:hypothetical protein TWF481_002915 [Arthrobotrys musiformis]|uniref:Uncharacterized protein n=1 Tax=Arthrobotrys musiformis TaxID=47236 RepID=A0AAV9VRT8_9PEZI
MKIHMPGQNINELQVMEKILDIISLSEECQGIKSAHEWRADTYRQLADWVEIFEELNKHTENLVVLGDELHRNVDKTDYFEVAPDHLSGSADTANNWSVQLFYTAPALVKTSNEDGEVYDVPELLVQGKIYALFISSDPATEERVLPDVAENTKMEPTSSANCGDLEGKDIGALTYIHRKTL